jgi:hypothetical protein
MATINPNDAAFAKSAFYHQNGFIDSSQEGLTKREYFAAIALQGLLAEGNRHQFNIIAEIAVEAADLIIEELNKTKQP